MLYFWGVWHGQSWCNFCLPGWLNGNQFAFEFSPLGLDIGYRLRWQIYASKWVSRFCICDVANGIASPQDAFISYKFTVHPLAQTSCSLLHQHGRCQRPIDTMTIDEVHLVIHVAMICFARCVATSAKFWLYSHLVQMCEVLKCDIPESLRVFFGGVWGSSMVQKSCKNLPFPS